MVNSGTPREEILKKFSNQKWALYQNYILDLNGFLHPGGNFVIEETLGREMTAFVTGSYALESGNGDLKPYNHSKDTYKFIQSAIIGTIERSFESSLLSRRE